MDQEAEKVSRQTNVLSRRCPSRVGARVSPFGPGRQPTLEHLLAMIISITSTEPPEDGGIEREPWLGDAATRQDRSRPEGTAAAARRSYARRGFDLRTPELKGPAVAGKYLEEFEVGQTFVHDGRRTHRALSGRAGGEVRHGARRSQARDVATETAKAMFALGSYAPAHPRLVGLTWGAEDLAAALGATDNKEADGAWTFPYDVAARAMPVLGLRRRGRADRYALCRFSRCPRSRAGLPVLRNEMGVMEGKVAFGARPDSPTLRKIKSPELARPSFCGLRGPRVRREHRRAHSVWALRRPIFLIEAR